MTAPVSFLDTADRHRGQLRVVVRENLGWSVALADDNVQLAHDTQARQRSIGERPLRGKGEVCPNAHDEAQS